MAGERVRGVGSLVAPRLNLLQRVASAAGSRLRLGLACHRFGRLRAPFVAHDCCAVLVGVAVAGVACRQQSPGQQDSSNKKGASDSGTRASRKPSLASPAAVPCNQPMKRIHCKLMSSNHSINPGVKGSAHLAAVLQLVLHNQLRIHRLCRKPCVPAISPATSLPTGRR